MKVIGIIGMLLSMWGIIWGIFIRDFLWLAAIGMVMMMFVLVFDDEEN